MKKILILTICIVTLFTSFSAFAEKEGTFNIIGIDEMLGSKDKWDDDSKLTQVNVTDKKIEREDATDYRVIYYTGKEYLNEIFEFDMTLNDLKEGETWNSVILRGTAKSSQTNIWDTNLQGYCFNIRTDSVEVQRYHNDVFLALGIYPCEIKSGEKFTVRVGAMNIEGGVQLLFYINGKQILNIFDNITEKDGYITAGGLFGLNNYSKYTVEPVKKKTDIEGIPVGFYISDYTTKTTALNADYKIIGNTEVKTAWYRCDAEPKWAKVNNKMTPPVELVKIEGSEDSKEYALTDADIGKYIVFGLTDKDGNFNQTNSVYINPVNYILSKGIYMAFDSSSASVDGEKVAIDENEAVVAKFIEKDSYIPLRFVVEKAGGEISWNGEKRAVEIKIGDYSSLITVGDTKATVNGSDISLKKAPVIDNDRTMIFTDDLYSLAGFYAENFHDCVVSVTKEDIELAVSEVAEIETFIIR